MEKKKKNGPHTQCNVYAYTQFGSKDIRAHSDENVEIANHNDAIQIIMTITMIII